MISLARALRLTDVPVVAFAGAGGKTSALFELARDLGSAVVTTTTHLGRWQAAWASRHDIWRTSVSMLEMHPVLAQGVTLVSGPIDDASDRVLGLDFARLQQLRELARQAGYPLLVEADGSRQRPLKAPAAHEPAIPPFADVVVVSAGLSGLGRPLSAEHVHRPEIFAALSSLSVGAPVTATALAAVLTHPSGGLKNIPPQARRLVLLNQADTPALLAEAASIAPRLLPHFAEVLVASRAGGYTTHGSETASGPIVHAAYTRVAGIVLAAGGSTRFGQPKPLLAYRGSPFVRIVAQTALAAGLHPVLVVTGANGDRVAAAVSDLDVAVVQNPAWQEGQGASVRAGMAALPQDTGAVVFLMADQPHVPPDVIRALVARHASGLFPIVAPHVAGRRATPTLFDRDTFERLRELSGDTGGRGLMPALGVEPVDWPDASLLVDVDTPDDYSRLLASQ